MRITVLDDDPGRKVDLSRERYRVLVDGVSIPKVFTADDEKGEVLAADVDEDGGFVLDENNQMNIKTKMIYGRVEIKRVYRSSARRGGTLREES